MCCDGLIDFKHHIRVYGHQRFKIGSYDSRAASSQLKGLQKFMIGLILKTNESCMTFRAASSQLKACGVDLMLPEDTLEHGECAPEVRTADLHCKDAGTHDPIADANQDPETRIIDQ